MKARKSGKALTAFILGSGLIVALLAAASAQAALTAKFDRYTLAVGDTVRMTLSSDGDEDPTEADLSALEEHFEVLQRSSTLNTSIINGERSRVKELILELTPTHEGDIIVPPFQIGRQRSEALQVSIGPAPKSLSGDEVVIFEAEVDKDSVYVQGQLLLTLRVQQAVNLESRSISELAIDNAVVETLGQNSFQRVIDGRPWLVHEIRYALFPQSSGELRIPVQTFSGRLATGRRSLFDTRPAGRLLRRQTEELVIDVMPRPASYPPVTWLPSAKLTLEEQWSGPLDELRIGDSVTRTITVTGEGLQGAQLPPIEGASGDGLRAYPDQPSINSMSGENGVTGLRTDSLALVAVAEGEYVLPAMEIPWWDTRSDSLQIARLPERRIRVAPSATVPRDVTGSTESTDSVDAADSLSTTTSNPLWQIVAAICAFGWLGTSLLLLRARRSTPSASTGPAKRADKVMPPASLSSVLAACKRNDPGAAHRALLQWLAVEAPGISLMDWARSSDERALSEAVLELQTRLYGLGEQTGSRGSSGWSGQPLAEALQAWSKAQGSGTKALATAQKSALPALYPAG
ncbi:MAG: BatD family protein [Congregibacter sp.]